MQNIQNMGNKYKHILTSMILEHWNSKKMNIVNYAVEMKMNSIVEKLFIISRTVIG